MFNLLKGGLIGSCTIQFIWAIDRLLMLQLGEPWWTWWMFWSAHISFASGYFMWKMK